jgi:hypothetical protein
MPPDETDFVRERFGQTVIDRDNRVGVAFRNQNGAV